MPPSTNNLSSIPAFTIALYQFLDWYSRELNVAQRKAAVVLLEDAIEQAVMGKRKYVAQERIAVPVLRALRDGLEKEKKEKIDSPK